MERHIRGHVDGFEGRFVSGWAICDDDDRACLVTISTDGGLELARGRASHAREDLREVGRGRSNIAFRVSVDVPADIETLHISADDVPLAGSPIRVGRGVFDGGFVVEQGHIRGSVTERAAGAPDPVMRFEDHYGRVVAGGHGVIPADRSLAWPVAARFDLPLAPTCFGFDELALRGFANDVEFAQSTCAARLVGYLEEIDGRQCRGWLLSPDAPDAQLEIEVFCNGQRVGSGRCDLPREDLKPLHPHSWRAGFSLDLKPLSANLSGGLHFSIRLADTATELFDGPFLISTRHDILVAARRGAALTRGDHRLSHDERHVVQIALSDYIRKVRHGPTNIRAASESRCLLGGISSRLNIVIPIYKGVAVTRVCIESVLATRDLNCDAIVLVNDCSPETGMTNMLDEFKFVQGVHLLNNATNLGFVGSINRALAFCRKGHVVLLNSDTRVFPGAWDEMVRILEASPEIGTITAMSNNATIFSYPHMTTVCDGMLADISWETLAAAALEANAGKIVDVPTGHGFCMLVRRAVLDQVGHLDRRFGRGYGEENDLCQRAADFGWRNVAACAVLVEHRESVSFGEEKSSLLHANMGQLNELYPEYTPTVMAYERADPLRVARWPLDRHCLRRASEGGMRFVLVVQNWLDGGTKTAIADIEAAYGYQGRKRMTLTIRVDGMRELEVETPGLLAFFGHSDDAALFDMLDAAGVDLVLVHQLLGSSESFVRQLGNWGSKRTINFYVHDFYSLCPRVTMLDAVNRFCKAADTETCERCLAMGGAHAASRFGVLPPAEHRALFAGFFERCTEIIAPSNDTVAWMQRVFPRIEIAARPHPELGFTVAETLREGNANQIVLLGAIGPHKGSRRLLELAKQARLRSPELQFHVVGYTDVDRELRAVGNVSITGPYEPGELAVLVDRTRGRLALFLHEWPETFSYTLSEAWRLGLFPIVADLGAPAERVRRVTMGRIFPAGDDEGLLALLLSQA